MNGGRKEMVAQKNKTLRNPRKLVFVGFLSFVVKNIFLVTVQGCPASFNPSFFPTSRRGMIMRRLRLLEQLRLVSAQYFLVVLA
jgi:hypothetical protein